MNFKLRIHKDGRRACVLNNAIEPVFGLTFKVFSRPSFVLETASEYPMTIGSRVTGSDRHPSRDFNRACAPLPVFPGQTGPDHLDKCALEVD
jgi:hypothetical protein